MEALARRSDVLSVGAATSAPLGGFAPESRPKTGDSHAEVNLFHVLPGYFEALNIPLLRGRLMDGNDVRTGGTVVISDSAARSLFPDRDPIGATIHDHEGRPFFVAGIVGDVLQNFQRDRKSAAYVIPGEETRVFTISSASASGEAKRWTPSRKRLTRPPQRDRLTLNGGVMPSMR
jgi:hypothetical protein